MYLKSIEIRGFKSFADKTVIEFKEGVTCVVGPNGSGKSNITDAVRWVLGEQRVKTLRGAKMEDIIFNGTKHRKSLGLAEVKLTFDNRTQFFPMDYDEISIVRKVHRSGESEYFLNQMPCRLKDVRELFMDTGIGREGYSIIGQGRIDEVLSNNKDERRLLFEEAAGIVKYKGRKQETEKKLKTTADNLLRIQDILSEIEDRVEPLKQESERAEKFIELSETLKSIELQAFGKRYLQCEQNILSFLEKSSQGKDELIQLEANQSDLKTLYNAEDQELYRLNHALRLEEEALHEALNFESKTIGDKQLLEEKIANIDVNIDRIEQECSELEVELHKAHENKTIQEAERDVLVAEKESKTLRLQALVDERHETLHALEQLNASNASDRQLAIDLLNAVEIKKREIENANKFVASLDERMMVLEQQINDIHHNIQKFEVERDDVLSTLEILEQRELEQNLVIAKRIESIQFFKKQHVEAYGAYEKARQLGAEYETEKKLLDTLEQEFEGYDKGVKEVMKHLPDQSGIHGVLASLIEVPKAYEVAIEVALGRMVQNIVCEKVSDAKRSIDYLRKNDLGRVTFLPLEHFLDSNDREESVDKIEKMHGYIGRASDLIVCDGKYRTLVSQLLNKSIVVEDFEAATAMLKIKNMKFKLITLKGDVLVPGGSITGGSFRSRISNVLGRKRRIDELAREIDVQSERANQYKIQSEQAHALASEDEHALKMLRDEVDQNRIEMMRLNHLKDNHTHWFATSSENLAKLQKDFDTLEKEKYETEKVVADKQIEIMNDQERSALIQEQLQHLHKDIEMFQSSIQTLLDEETHLKIGLASLIQNISFKEKECLRLDDDHDTILQKKTLRVKQLEHYNLQKKTFFEQSGTIDSSLATTRAEIDKKRVHIRSKSEDKRLKSDHLRKLTHEVTELTYKQDQIKEGLHRFEVQLAKLEVEKDTITAELWERYEMSIAEALQVDGELPKAEIKQLKLELKLLGNVNVGAIKEYQEVSERYHFLTVQKKDLSDAVLTLEKIIGDLDRQMIQLFKTHFEAINEHFKETFVSLFNGGDAELILADYDDLLNCDIDIIAQPPGKKLQSINLLSGGEKALTAIALLFAILKTKPSPFCILDEIEAALDDVNVYRFAGFIKEYAANSQFVVITHRKGTMEIADTLYGVTMEEYGISKVLSVKLEDVQSQYN